MQANELLNMYHVDANTWDEMYKDAFVREQYRGVVEFMQELSVDELNKKEELARKLVMSQGITFTVYSSGEGIEKILLLFAKQNSKIPKIVLEATGKSVRDLENSRY